MKKVILGMSGGVDSTIAAKLLQEQGYEVIGMFMNCDADNKKRWPTTIDWNSEEKALKDICKRLNIKLIVKNTGEGYEKKVISKMFKEYSKNLTPNPDTLCNSVGKFPLLYSVMKEEKADFIATGHYARIKKEGKKIKLLMGKDPKKDQSYFLIGIKNKYLAKCLFPVGELTKEEVRQMAKLMNFKNWDKRSSRGICYLGKIDMREFLESRINKKKGNVLDTKNNIIGEHEGSYFFTIGQRISFERGVSLNKLGKKLYSGSKLLVARKTKKNELIVAEPNDPILKTKIIRIKKLFKIDKNEEIVNKKFNVRIRHLGEFHKGKLIKDKNYYYFKFDQGVESIASGQIIGLYNQEIVVGGGEMKRIE